MSFSPALAYYLRRKKTRPGGRLAGAVVGPTPDPVFPPPVITSPADQTILTNGTAKTLTASAPNGTSSLEFFADGVSLGLATANGDGTFSKSWTPSSVDYSVALTAVANNVTSSARTLVTAEANRFVQTLNGWTLTNCVVTSGQSDPDGGASAYKIAANAGSGISVKIDKSASPSNSNANSGFEIWLEYNASAPCVMLYPLDDGAVHYIHINLLTGETLGNFMSAHIVETRGNWKRVWFRMQNGAILNTIYGLFLCKTLGVNTDTFAGTEFIRMYKPRSADGVLPFTDGQQMTAYRSAVSGSLETWSYKSPFIDSASDNNYINCFVIKPTGWTAGVSYKVVYVLPALNEASENVKNVITTGGYANTYNCVIIIPNDKDGFPWFADHVDGVTKQQQRFLVGLKTFATDHFTTDTDFENHRLVGYSKSGWGAVSTMLRHPGAFGKAAVWDVPFSQTYSFMAGAGFGNDVMMGSQAQFNAYNPSTILAANKAAVSDKARLSIRGGYSWTTDTTDFKALLDANGVPCDYDNTTQASHAYLTAWLDGSMAWLLA